MEALEHFARALTTYVAVVDDVAQKSRPASRALYQNALAGAAALSEAGPPRVSEDASGAALAAEAFSALARLEGVQADLDAGAAAALDPSLLDSALRQMSRTFVEGVEQKASRLRDARAQAATTAQAAVATVVAEVAPRIAAATGGEDIAAVAAAYADSPKTAAGGSLYAKTLEIWMREGADVAALVEKAKDDALGIPPDTPAAVREAIDARAGLHPLQAMALTFGFEPAETVDGDGGAMVAIDATLPQAGTAVRYNLAPLIDAKVAAKFGPLASTSSGLNFRLVERLRTVIEEPLAEKSMWQSHNEGVAITTREGGAPSIVRTIDRGATFDKLQPTQGLPPDRYLSVGAGPRPRVEQLGVLLEEAVYGDDNKSAAVRTFGDPEQLVEDYDAKVDALEPSFTLDELGQALQARFAVEFDAAAEAAPVTPESFLTIVLGQRTSRDPYRTYIARTISEVAKRGGERSLLRNTLSGGSVGAALFGSRALAARGGRQEILLTQVAELRASIFATQQSLSKAYTRINGSERARRVFLVADQGEHTSKTGRVRLAADLRRRALELYRAIIEEAFYSKRRATGRAAKVVEKQSTIESRLNLKLFLLEHGDTSITAQ